MKRSEFLKTTGLGIGGFVLGVGLNLGMLFGKKESGVDADEYHLLKEPIHYNLQQIPAVKFRRSGMEYTLASHLYYHTIGEELRADRTSVMIRDEHEKVWGKKLDRPIVIHGLKGEYRYD